MSGQKLGTDSNNVAGGILIAETLNFSIEYGKGVNIERGKRTFAVIPLSVTFGSV